MLGHPYSLPHNYIFNNHLILNIFTYTFLNLFCFSVRSQGEGQYTSVLNRITVTLFTHNKQHRVNYMPVL